MFKSKKYKFCFTRVSKNASTSVAQWLIKNYADPTAQYTRVGDASICDQNIPNEYIELHKKDFHFIHTTLQEIWDGGFFEYENIEDYYNFAIIRDPLERQISLFHFLNRNAGSDVSLFRSLFKDGRHVSDESNKILQTDYLRLDGVQKGQYWAYPKIEDLMIYLIDNYKIEGAYHPLKFFKSRITPIKEKNELIDTYYDKYTRQAVLDYYAEDYKLYADLMETK